MNFRMKDSGNFARNLPQSKEITATLGREVASFIMSGFISFPICTDCVYVNTCPTSLLGQPARPAWQASTPYTGKYYTLRTVQRCPEASDRTGI